MGVISMKQLLEAGVHFGHQTRRWNPKMDKYIYTSRGGIHIIDLQKTVVLVEDAYQKLLEVGKNGGKVLFVGTKKQARDVVKDEALRTGQYYVSQRWLGGTLTNFKTIRKSIRKLHDLNRMEVDGTFDRLTKKEVIQKRKEMERLEKFLGGIKDMKSLPEALFVVDPMQEKNAVLEAKKLGIPVFGIVDTNCDPDLVDVIIPGNDDAIRSVKLIVGKLADAFIIAAGGVVEPTPEAPRPERKPYDKTRKPYNNDRKPYNKDRKPYKPYRGPITATLKPAENSKPANKKFEAPKKVETTVVAAKPVAVEPVAVKPVAAKPVAAAPVAAKSVAVKPVAVEKPVKKVTAEKVSVDLSSMKVAELKALAKERKITGYSKLKKAELVEALK